VAEATVLEGVAHMEVLDAIRASGRQRRTADHAALISLLPPA
jgi:hypothetical protein